MPIQAVLFDAFGTLCEIADRKGPYRPLLKAWSGGVAAAYQALMTRPDSLGALAAEAGCSAATIARMEEALRVEIGSMRLFPEVADVLQMVRGHGLRWGIVSNLASPYAEPLLRLLPFRPDVCSWSFAVGSRKPEAAIYLHACEALHVPASAVLMVGDSLENDYAQPRALGMKACLLQRSATKMTAMGITDLRGIREALEG